jgi:hypothetical protein
MTRSNSKWRRWTSSSLLLIRSQHQRRVSRSSLTTAPSLACLPVCPNHCGLPGSVDERDGGREGGRVEVVMSVGWFLLSPSSAHHLGYRSPDTPREQLIRPLEKTSVVASPSLVSWISLSTQMTMTMTERWSRGSSVHWLLSFFFLHPRLALDPRSLPPPLHIPQFICPPPPPPPSPSMRCCSRPPPSRLSREWAAP